MHRSMSFLYGLLRSTEKITNKKKINKQNKAKQKTTTTTNEKKAEKKDKKKKTFKNYQNLMFA